jgi:hypothetical protein
LASSHLSLGLFSSSSPGTWEDCRLEPSGRGCDDERRGPAFWRVFCKVMSFSESSWLSTGRAAETGEATAGTEPAALGEFWNDGFFKMPVLKTQVCKSGKTPHSACGVAVTPTFGSSTLPNTAGCGPR